jgi:hypothetical protein
MTQTHKIVMFDEELYPIRCTLCCRNGLQLACIMNKQHVEVFSNSTASFVFLKYERCYEVRSYPSTRHEDAEGSGLILIFILIFIYICHMQLGKHPVAVAQYTQTIHRVI